VTPGVRKLALTLHVSTSMSWLGGVASFLALALVGLEGGSAEASRAAYVGMELLTRAVLLPLSLASLLTGLVQALGTPWGLFRHHWVVAKLFLTVACTLLLWMHFAPIEAMGRRALAAPLLAGDSVELRKDLVVKAAEALLALLLVTALAVYKPKGLTRFGRSRQERGAVRDLRSSAHLG